MQRTDGKAGRVMGRLAPWVVGVLALAALWVWADRLLPGGEPAGMAVLGPEDCDLNLQACTAELPSGRQVTLDLQPRPMPALQPLEVRLELTGQDPDWVELDLAGVEMYMGFNRSRLERVGPGSYRGQTVLPVCASEAMTWAATVLPDGAQDRGEVQFRFLTRR
ncbi:hypothetical protein [Thioalkalivibrio sp.]|uniref:hypothetical protein n=1 Tax=Thioalkalivibrio sp. TaxID=2093813 RepID=UPI0039761404